MHRPRFAAVVRLLNRVPAEALGFEGVIGEGLDDLVVGAVDPSEIALDQIFASRTNAFKMSISSVAASTPLVSIDD